MVGVAGGRADIGVSGLPSAAVTKILQALRMERIKRGLRENAHFLAAALTLLVTSAVLSVTPKMSS